MPRQPGFHPADDRLPRGISAPAGFRTFRDERHRTKEPDKTSAAVEFFELKESLSPGGHALAYLMRWDRDAEDYVATTLEEDIYDPLGVNSGGAGDRFECLFSSASRHNEIIGGVGGSGAVSIKFTVYDIVRGKGLLCNALDVTVDSVSCSGSGVEIGDSVTVWDDEGCHTNAPMELFIGAKGKATRFQTNEYDLFGDGGEEQETPCHWAIDWICCVEESS